VLFALVGAITFFNIPDHVINDRLIESILSGITLAMAMIPEEFPVILTVFLSMGAWRLAKKQSLVVSCPRSRRLALFLCFVWTNRHNYNESDDRP
jgi:Ca2+-transporting ATPase